MTDPDTSTSTSTTGKRSRLLRFGLPALLIVALAAGGVWYFLLRDDSPGEFTIEDATSGIDNSDDDSTTSDPDGENSTGDDANDAPLDSVEGTWVIADDAGPAGAPSEAGYRVDEELADIGDKTVVGRTEAVTGEMTIAGTEVTNVSIEVDMASIRTDSGNRDSQYRSALDVDEFPTATFELTEPIELGAIPADGETIEITATGDFTIHGVTRTVDVALDAQRNGSTLTVVGRVPVTFADYDVETPSAAIVVSLDDHGLIEFQLYLTKS